MRSFLPNWLSLCLLGSILVGPPAQAEEVDFSRDLRPLFERYCSECHGAEKQRGGLRLDQPAGLTAGGDSC
jgi:mono/diheme cytochrome c family protein